MFGLCISLWHLHFPLSNRLSHKLIDLSTAVPGKNHIEGLSIWKKKAIGRLNVIDLKTEVTLYICDTTVHNWPVATSRRKTESSLIIGLSICLPSCMAMLLLLWHLRTILSSCFCRSTSRSPSSTHCTSERRGGDGGGQWSREDRKDQGGQDGREWQWVF